MRRKNLDSTVAAMRRMDPDLTAGERARAIYADPAASQPVIDPTDPRYGSSGRMSSTGGGGSVDPTAAGTEWRRAGHPADPTDPRAGRQAARADHAPQP